MTPKGRKHEKPDEMRKTSLVIPDALLQRLKVACVEERTDVSALLCRLAEEWLKTRKGVRR